MHDISATMEGFAAPGWGEVADAFADALALSGAGGAALCIYQAGRPVADLAAGVADPATGRAYTPGTLQPFMSVSRASWPSP